MTDRPLLTPGVPATRHPFADRRDAGRQLGERLVEARLGDVVVLGLPRGGVPVAAAVATALGAPLDVLVVRKLGLPFQPEVAMGAIAEGGVLLVDQMLIARFGVTDDEIADVERRERATLDARLARLRRGRPLRLRDRTVVIVDDGIATGATATAACRAARALGAARVIVAAPVGSPRAVDTIEGADEVICLLEPETFSAVGQYYRDFSATSETEVELLLRAAQGQGQAT